MSNIHENFCFQLTNLFKEFIHRIQNKEGEIISQVITKSLKYKILLNFTHVTMKLSMRVEHKMSVFSVHAAPKKVSCKVKACSKLDFIKGNAFRNLHGQSLVM